MIRNGPVASQHSPELGGIDFTKDGHSLLGLHANAGITFDVAAMRNALVESSKPDTPTRSQARRCDSLRSSVTSVPSVDTMQTRGCLLTDDKLHISRN